MRSHQYSLGGYYTGIKGWEFSVEGYYKDMYNVLEYKDGVSFFGSSTGWESKVEMGKGRSMGIEFMAQKNAREDNRLVVLYLIQKRPQIC